MLILNDGQNLFEPERAYVPGEPWRVGETADALVEAGAIPPMVIAGIDHAGPRRIFDFTPTRGEKGMGGGAATFANLLVNEALPFIRAHYAVTSDPNQTGVGGSSLGGLVTLYTVSAHPGVFGRCLVMSPSVWWSKRWILGAMPSAAGPEGVRAWVDIGLREGASSVRNARRLRRVIGRIKPPVDIRYVEDPDGDHSERAWARRLPAALAFLFGSGSARPSDGHPIFDQSIGPDVNRV